MLWGTFGILIPIIVAVSGHDMNLLTMTVAAVLAGAVAGDHLSPISDTTIMSSTGAQCHHIDHVQTQLPYGLTVSACCIVGYLAAGFAGNGLVGTAVGFFCLACVAFYIYHFKMEKNKA